MPTPIKSVERILRESIAYEPNTGCWLWTGTLRDRRQGYGTLRHKGKRWRAHIFVYTHLVGPVPKGRVLDHKCSIHGCVNPDHLEPVTGAENTRRGRRSVLLQTGTCPKCGSTEITIEADGKYEHRRCGPCRREYKRNYQRARMQRVRAQRAPKGLRLDLPDGWNRHAEDYD